MISIENKNSLERDDRYLTNAAKLESVLTPALFKESFIGEWKLHDDNKNSDSDSDVD